MSRETARGRYDKSVNDPEKGFITAGDAQAAINDIYDDLEAVQNDSLSKSSGGQIDGPLALHGAVTFAGSVPGQVLQVDAFGQARPTDTPVGPEGPEGPEGPPGPPGPRGFVGESAYERAVANGFIGNEAAWLESLKSTVEGPQGEEGPEGPPGEVTQAELDAAVAVKADSSAIGNRIAIADVTNYRCSKTDMGGGVWRFLCTPSLAGWGPSWNGIPVIAGETVTVTVTYQAIEASQNFNVQVLFRDSLGVIVTESLATGAMPTTATTKTKTFVVPAGAVKATLDFSRTSGSNIGQGFDVWNVGLWGGAGGEYRDPGVPIPNLGHRRWLATPIEQTQDWGETDWAPLPVRVGTGTPVSVVTPQFVGQIYVDNAAGAAYIATTLTSNTAWKRFTTA